MESIMLAAGIGSRLSKNDKNHPPKCLLTFNGKSLLARHIETLKSCGITKLTLIIGYRAGEIEAEISKIDNSGFVETIINPEYLQGSIVSLSYAKKTMQSGADILFMDADVLYHSDLIQRLASSIKDCHILYDRDYEPGDDPVLLCLNGKRIVEFKKEPHVTCDHIGEWPGFVKWSPKAAMELSNIIQRRISSGQTKQPCEDAFREYMLKSELQNIYCDDITGIPWIEIDFPDDINRAHNVVLPAIKNYTR
jgi:choline kinase